MNWVERKKAVATIAIVPEISPYVFISQEAADKMEIVIAESKNEVGWLCSVKQGEGNTFLIEDIFILKQDVHATTTEITAEGLQEFATELMNAGDAGMEIWGKLNGWGHSHVNMGVTPSHQDNEQMKLFIANGCKFFIRLIGNKKGEMEISLFDYRTAISYKNVPWRVIPSEAVLALEAEIEALEDKILELQISTSEQYEKQIKLELAEKVKPLTYAVGKHWGRPGSVVNYPSQNQMNLDNYVLNEKKTTVTQSEAKSVTSIADSSSAVKNSVVNMAYISLAMTEDDILEVGACTLFSDAHQVIRSYFPELSYSDLKVVWEYCLEAYDQWITLTIIEQTGGR